MDFLDGDFVVGSRGLSTFVHGRVERTRGTPWSGAFPMLPNSTRYSLGQTGRRGQLQLVLPDPGPGHGGRPARAAPIIRPGWEFNGGWFPWAANGQAAAFIGYWQQIVNTMRSVPGPGLQVRVESDRRRSRRGESGQLLPRAVPTWTTSDSTSTTRTGARLSRGIGVAVEHRSDHGPFGLDWLSILRHRSGKTDGASGVGIGPRSTGEQRCGRLDREKRADIRRGDNPTFINDMAQWITGSNDVYEASYWQFGIERC